MPAGCAAAATAAKLQRLCLAFNSSRAVSCVDWRQVGGAAGPLGQAVAPCLPGRAAGCTCSNLPACRVKVTLHVFDCQELTGVWKPGHQRWVTQAAYQCSCCLLVAGAWTRTHTSTTSAPAWCLSVCTGFAVMLHLLLLPALAAVR